MFYGLNCFLAVIKMKGRAAKRHNLFDLTVTRCDVTGILSTQIPKFSTSDDQTWPQHILFFIRDIWYIISEIKNPTIKMIICINLFFVLNFCYSTCYVPVRVPKFYFGFVTLLQESPLGLRSRFFWKFLKHLMHLFRQSKADKNNSSETSPVTQVRI